MNLIKRFAQWYWKELIWCSHFPGGEPAEEKDEGARPEVVA